MAKALGVTEGSFYWHFRDRQALLARWEKNATQAIIDEIDAGAARRPSGSRR
jgi:AcrR family transcriptional regulator